MSSRPSALLGRAGDLVEQRGAYPGIENVGQLGEVHAALQNIASLTG